MCSWQVAYGSDGSPSKALEGFCRKNAVAAADVTVEADGKGTEYVWAVVKQRGRAAAEARARTRDFMYMGALDPQAMRRVLWRTPFMCLAGSSSCTPLLPQRQAKPHNKHG